MTQIAIISGSQRQDSQSLKIAKMLAAKLDQHDQCTSADVVDLGVHPLPFWDPALDDAQQAQIKQVADKVADKDGFIIISPEWHGMVPATLKNFFLHFGKDVFAHKPALIAAVSAGIGGAYPINELRISSYKNSRLCYLPEHLIFRHVGSIFNQDGENDEKSQAYMSKRSDYCLNLLLEYSKALAMVREAMPDTGDFANGM